MAGEERQQRPQPNRVELPPIRQAVPQINENPVPEQSRDLTQSPRTVTGSSTINGYIPSPSEHKRRRDSFEEDSESEPREHHERRRHRSPPRQSQSFQNGTNSPTFSTHQPSALSSSGRWTPSTRTSPYSQHSTFPAARSPPPRYEMNRTSEPSSSSRPDLRPTLPSLPMLPQDRGMHRGRNHVNEYALDSTRSGAQTYPPVMNSAFPPPASSFHLPPTANFHYGYQQPRGQSYSGPSGPPLLDSGRMPFSQTHQPMYPASQYTYGMSDSVHDNKQRKRRGNLPKDTTDKLRAWFMANLNHPYPTEDQKQDLMRQTHLQINQISNWFINARRRQLPTMINNARAESSASARAATEGEANTHGGDHYGPVGESDGDGSGEDDEDGR
ncbi:Homeobox protein homothorax, partial [Lachnellula suecica]